MKKSWIPLSSLWFLLSLNFRNEQHFRELVLAKHKQVRDS